MVPVPVTRGDLLNEWRGERMHSSSETSKENQEGIIHHANGNRLFSPDTSSSDHNDFKVNVEGSVARNTQEQVFLKTSTTKLVTVEGPGRLLV